MSADDRRIESLARLERAPEVVVTEKLDGENLTLMRDHAYGRSTDDIPPATRSRAKALHAEIAHGIPEGWRVCVENLIAPHRIVYRPQSLVGLGALRVHSIWNEHNVALSWMETEEWAGLLGLLTVPVLRRPMVWVESSIRMLNDRESSALEVYERCPIEGYVVRDAGSIALRDYKIAVAKFVRKEFRPALPGSGRTR